MARLDDAAIQRFLGGKDVVILATVQRDGSPLATPMWHVPDPAAIYMLSVTETQKIRNLRRDPRVSMVAEEGGKTGIRGVTVQGRATFLDDSPERRALVEQFHARYSPHLEGFWGGRAMPANRVMFRIDPVAVHAWGFGG